MAAPRLYVFGPPRLEHDGPPVGLQKAMALLVYLAAGGQPQSRETLATLLWPDLTRREALTQLRRVLHRLKQSVGEGVLAVTRETVGLQPDAGLWVDAAAFERHAAAGLAGGLEAEAGPERLEHLRRAAALYTGEFLAGFALPDSEAWEEWAFFKGESLRRSCAGVLEQLVLAYQRQGSPEAAISYARRWLALDPLQEAPHRALMQLYASTGQEAAALRQYQECARLLDAELGIEPAEETTALYEAIRTRTFEPWGTTPDHPPSEPSGGPRSPGGPGQIPPSTGVHPLPSPTTPFVGRERELRELAHLLVDEPRARLVTVLGIGGIGKTRLALAAASAVKGAFRHGVVFVPLVSLTSSLQLLAALAEGVGLRFYPGHPPQEQLLNYLREKELLLLLDNFEQLGDGVETVAEILEVAPRVSILATSRERLNLSGEVVYTVGNLPFPSGAGQGNALEYGAVQLMLQQARLVRPDLDLRAYDLASIVRICRLVQGVPLAIVLAAGWLEVLSFGAIADELTRSFDLLEGQWHDLPERQRSLRATFDYSWQRLSAGEQRVLMWLSVFQGGFTAQAIQRVTGCTLQQLRALVNKSFLARDREHRYQIHELLRQYAGEALERSGEADAARDAHATYYLQTLQRLEGPVKGGDQLRALEAIDEDLENIRAAWLWALQRANYRALGEAIEALYLFFAVRSRYQEAIELFRQTYECLASDTAQAAVALAGRLLSRLAFFQTLVRFAPDEVGRDLESSLAIAREQGDPVEIAFSTLITGCHHYLSTHDYALALACFEESLRGFRAMDDRFYVTVALQWLGEVHGNATDLARFLEFTRESLALARRHGDMFSQSLDLDNLVTAALCAGEYGAAEAYCHEALPLFRSLNFPLGVAEISGRLALLALLRGEREEARRLAEAAFQIAGDVGYPITLAHVETILGLEAIWRGDYQTGRLQAERSLAIPSNFFEATLAHWTLALAHCGLGACTEARTSALAALRLARDRAFVGLLPWPLAVLALTLAHDGQPERAAEVLALASTHPLSPMNWAEGLPLFATFRARLERELGARRFSRAWERGRALDLEAVTERWLGRSENQRQDPRADQGARPQPVHVEPGAPQNGKAQLLVDE